MAGDGLGHVAGSDESDTHETAPAAAAAASTRRRVSCRSIPRIARGLTRGRASAVRHDRVRTWCHTAPQRLTITWSNGRIIDATSTTAPSAWRRYLYLMLDAYRAERAHSIPEPPMTYEQLYDAMVHLSEAE